ncbi:MAG TPA: hypothetical protein VLI05_01390 [Candidatus Saccharimonadia bacterium]|nr:hypothetical protein [Candidatus Saccharimonadia bacterium]
MDASTWGALNRSSEAAAEFTEVNWPRVGLVFESDPQTGRAISRRAHGYVPDDAEDNGEPAIALATHDLMRRAAGTKDRVIIMAPFEFEMFVATRHVLLKQLADAIEALSGYYLTLPMGGGDPIRASQNLNVLVLPRPAIAALAKQAAPGSLEDYREHPDALAFLLRDESLIQKLTAGNGTNDLRAAS